ncbi:hypothetical protein [Nitrosospira multiformis]|uniref:hypothetical protein n=1 Tax=Nitrosospira multiformis TaxID=1231 RepID=UPI00089CF725|nr:hypothetical protein [Nitrosospira multiformis]SDZ88046.1 hypothetical protein SAMN05216411_102257 [Nitrosospira multiformis]
MSDLKTVWFGMLTDDSDDSGTDSSIVLIINVRGGRFDVLHRTFPDTEQNDQEQGQANLYEITEDDFEPQPFVGSTVDPQDLNASSIRIGIRGNDMWRPKSVFIWGEQKDGLIVPLALNTELQGDVGIAGQLVGVALSTDSGEGKLSFAPARVQLGDQTVVIRRLLILLTTADVDNAGTDDDIALRITTADGRVAVDHVFPDTSQDDLEQAQANFYFASVDIPFTRAELNADSIRLSIKGNDAWAPARLFLFGLSEPEGGQPPEFVVPLVHLPKWPLGALSTDTGEGQESVVLPLLDNIILL